MHRDTLGPRSPWVRKSMVQKTDVCSEVKFLALWKHKIIVSLAKVHLEWEGFKGLLDSEDAK